MSSKQFPRPITRLLTAAVALVLTLFWALPTALAAKTPTLSKTTATLIVGQSTTLKVKNGRGKITWKSGSPKVVTVKKGKLTAKKKGTAKVTVKVAKKTLTCKVTVENPYISKTKATLNVGDKLTLKLNGTKQKVTWRSSATGVATVTAKGVVTAKKKGTATITAAVLGRKYICKVTVENPVISRTKVTLTAGDKLTLKVSGTTQTVKWASSATGVAVVTAKGVVTAKKAGTATVTATAGSRKLSCKVTVKNVEIPQQTAATPTVSTQKLPDITMGTRERTISVDDSGKPSGAASSIPVTKTVAVATITFETLPTNLEELKQYEPLLQDKERGRFVILGLVAAAFRTYDATTVLGANQTMYEMLAYLGDSPWQLNTKRVSQVSLLNRQIIDRALRQDARYRYWGNLFWEDSWYHTGYQASAPYTIHVEEYIAFCPAPAVQDSSFPTPEYDMMACYGCKYQETDEVGSDMGNFSTVRRYNVTWSDGRWYLFDDLWRNELLVDAGAKPPDGVSG